MANIVFGHGHNVSSLFSPLNPANDIAWDSPGSSYNHTETQTVYISAGHQCLFVQLAHVNLGLGVNIQFSYQYIDTLKNLVIFKTGGIVSKTWSLADDRRSVRAGVVSIQCEPGTFKYSVIVEAPHRIQIQFEPEGNPSPVGYRVGTGRAVFGDASDASYISHTFLPRCNVRNCTFRLDNGDVLDLARDTSIHAFFIHANQRDRPFNLACRWQFSIFQSKNFTAHAIEFLPAGNWTTEDGPSSDGSKKDLNDSSNWIKQGSVIRTDNSQPLIFNTKSHIKVLEVGFKDVETGYFPPSKVQISYPSTDGDAGCSAMIEANTVLVSRIDMLDQLPWLLRRLIQALITKPFGYQFYNEAEIVFQDKNGQELKEMGWIFNEVTFMM